MNLMHIMMTRYHKINNQFLLKWIKIIILDILNFTRLKFFFIPPPPPSKDIGRLWAMAVMLSQVMSPELAPGSKFEHTWINLHFMIMFPFFFQIIKRIFFRDKEHIFDPHIMEILTAIAQFFFHHGSCSDYRTKSECFQD